MANGSYLRLERSMGKSIWTPVDWDEAMLDLQETHDYQDAARMLMAGQILSDGEWHYRVMGHNIGNIEG